MGDFKLRFADIFRYIVLGAVQCILVCTVIGFGNVTTYLNGNTWIKNESIITLVLVISIFYLMGFMTQLIIQLYCKGNLLGTGLGEVGKYIRSHPNNFLNTNKYPHWLYYSKNPGKVLGIYRETMETDNEGDRKTQFLDAADLFQGIALSIIVFSIFFLWDGFYITKDNSSNSITLNMENPMAPLVISGVIVFLICLVGYKSSKNEKAMIFNKCLILAAPALILLSYSICGLTSDRSDVDNGEIGLIIALALFLCLSIAEQLTRRHIRRIDTLIKYGKGGSNEEQFLRNLERNGVPLACILTRVNDKSLPYYEEQLESIRAQRYPNLKVIALIDKQSNDKDKIISIIDRYRKEHKLNIIHYISAGSGPASLNYEIRDIFLNMADNDDVAISLDSDDLFASKDVVTRIMGRMSRTKANICLLTFETFGDTTLNNAKNYPNEFVKQLSHHTETGKAVTPDFLLEKDKAHVPSTIGWTKCYRADVLRPYQRLWDKYRTDLDKKSKFEDFPDIVVLLSGDSRICAVGRTSVLFRKHGDSITAATDINKFDEHIPYYLQMAVNLSEAVKVPESSETKQSKFSNKWLKKIKKSIDKARSNGDSTPTEDTHRLSPEARRVIMEKFVPYKFVQYLNIIKKKTDSGDEALAGYTPRHFYDKFVDKIYGGDEAMFDSYILEILKENAKLRDEDQSGFYANDLPDALNKQDVTIAEFRSAFDID